MTIKNIMLILMMTVSFYGIAQNKLKNFLIDHYENNSKNNPKSLKYFRAGNYKKAYKLLDNSNSTSLFNYQEFLNKSVLYQRDSMKLRKALELKEIKLTEFQEFYAKQNQMRVILDKSTTIHLDNNIIKGVVGNDTIKILFDTGGAGVSIDKKFVEKYGMITDTTISTEGYVPSIDYRSIGHPTIIPSLKIGDMVMKNVPAKFSRPKEGYENKSTDVPEFDMIMGLDIFIGFINNIRFDWEQETLTISKENSKLKNSHDFIFFDRKPIALFNFKKKYYTTLLDTGASVDLADKDVYINDYTKKESKSYGSYNYNQYTFTASVGNNPVKLIVADYNRDFNLKLNNENIDFIVGTNRKFLEFNLKNNTFIIK